ncbi:extracellular solute-binding protein [Psychrobacter sp. I-STPA6b]|uniref:extracellular solute-binding protein n=1 Tax=Psychrobacter sp. I-STPA6b TaxID=2585718 RepID=UPI001D0C0004|nr:extracellular solute-binding protein [Psychrobacter sp. I-STPA6b]
MTQRSSWMVLKKVCSGAKAHWFNCLRQKARLVLMGAVVLSGISGCTPAPSEPVEEDGMSLNTEVISVATDMDTALLLPAMRAFTEETGIQVVLHSIDMHSFIRNAQADNPSIQTSEPVDVFLLYQSVLLTQAEDADILQAVSSEVLPERLGGQGEDKLWYGLSYYGRTLVYNQQRVNEAELFNYADLSSDKWRGRLCLSSSQLPANQALIGHMINYRGEQKTQEVVAGWVANLAQPVLADDMAVITAISHGQCDVGIVGSDVFIHYVAENPKTPVRLAWANQINNGTVIDVIGGAISKEALNPDDGLRLLEWLSEDTGQALLSFYSYTFPLASITDPNINRLAIRPEWTKFQADNNTPYLKSISDDERAEIKEIIEQAGYL